MVVVDFVERMKSHCENAESLMTQLQALLIGVLFDWSVSLVFIL